MAGFNPPTAKICHQVLHRALKRAVRDHVIHVNPATVVENKPRPKRDQERARQNCWSGAEMVKVVNAVTSAGPQMSAFFTLALDTGARRGELAGLKWADVDFDTCRVHIERQLVSGGAFPVFRPTKSGRDRTITNAPETLARLRQHRAAQRELRMRNRPSYVDHDLIFAMETEDLFFTNDDRLGHPLRRTSLDTDLSRLITAAGVRKISMHGLRHSCLTALLTAGVPVHVVSHRAGHADATITMLVYAHALPDAQQAGADAMRGVLYGR